MLPMPPQQFMTTELEKLHKVLSVLYETKTNILLEDPLDAAAKNYTSALKLACVNSRCDKIVCAREFMVDFEQFKNDQLFDYPDNLITQMTLVKNYATLFVVKLDDFISNYVVLQNVPKQHDPNFVLAKELKKYHRMHTGWYAAFMCFFAFLFLAVIFYALCAVYASSPVLWKVFLICLGVAVCGGVSSLCFVPFFKWRMREVYHRDKVPEICTDGCSNLADIIFYLVSMRTIIRALEQALVIKNTAYDLPKDIVNLLIGYSIGDVQRAMNNFFSNPQQVILIDYFNSKQYITVTDVNTDDSQHSDNEHDSDNCDIKLELLPPRLCSSRI